MSRFLSVLVVLVCLLPLACNGNGGNGDPDCPGDKDCSGLECGLDPVCGLSCGACPSGQSCVSGTCEGPTCPDDKDCAGLDCGPDPVCQESCGSCADGESCQGGACVGPDCPDDKDCNGLTCGPDPICAESCGTCGDEESCQDGACVGLTCPDDMDCGDRVCGQETTCCESCGECLSGEACTVDGQCSTDWPPPLETIYQKECRTCLLPTCDPNGDPGYDFETDADYWRKLMITTASDCPDILGSFDPITLVGSRTWEHTGVPATGTCIFMGASWGGGTAKDGVISWCALLDWDIMGVHGNYRATVDHKNQSPASGFAYVEVVNLPVDILGIESCNLEMDIVYYKCPGEMDCDGVNCGPDWICGMDCGNCQGDDQCVEGHCCPSEVDCDGLECGPDPVCGELCGECGAGNCQDGLCPECPGDQDCSNMDCGLDPICNLSCGDCQPDERCIFNKCEPAGTPAETVEVPAGTFMMGCNTNVDDQCNPVEDCEDPYHEVNLDTYRIYKHEVTAGDYKACVDAGVCTAATTGVNYTYDVDGQENHPINGVNWPQAEYFCAWVGGSLPTEAQWEKAARSDDGRKYPWGNEPAVSCTHAVVTDDQGVGGCGTGATLPVGSKPDGASPYGAEDMVGGVIEFVADHYDADYYSVSPTDNPQGPETGNLRVTRGGGWEQADTSILRCSFRAPSSETYQTDNHGFRCALPAE